LLGVLRRSTRKKRLINTRRGKLLFTQKGKSQCIGVGGRKGGNCYGEEGKVR